MYNETAYINQKNSRNLKKVREQQLPFTVIYKTNKNIKKGSRALKLWNLLITCLQLLKSLNHMWKFIIIFIISLSAFDNAFAGQPDGIGKFIVTDINDKDSTLNKVRMFPPKFYRIGNGRRIEIKVCNEDSMQIRRVRCLLYYSGSGKRKCINKIWISPLEGNETYYFCMNIKLKLTKEEWSRLTFRIKRGKSYKDYRFSDTD